MLKTVFFFMMFVCPLVLQAQTLGFDCQDLKIKIFRVDLNPQVATILVKNEEAGRDILIGSLQLPIDDSVDSYQERYGIYYGLMSEAHLNFPYMPDWLMFFHMSRSTRLYKKGFKAFEGEGEPVELPKLYCKAFLKVLELN